MNLLGIISAILALAAFSATYQLLNKKPTKLKISLALSSLLLSLPGASFAFYYTHLLPESAWYYQFRSTVGSELLLIPMGVFGGCAASLLPRKILILPLLATAGFAITPFLKPLVAPLTLTPTDEWAEDICLQSTSSTCGPASTATLLKHFDIRENEETLAKECYSYASGTECWYLARAIRQRGLCARFKQLEELPTASNLPAIIGVKLGATGHFIPILENNGNSVIIGDPLRGREELNLEEFHQRYTLTGFTMIIKK